MNDDSQSLEEIARAVGGRGGSPGQRRALARLVEALSSEAMSRREFLQRSAALGISVAAAQHLLGALPRADAAAAPRRGGVLKAAFSADPAGFDPVRGPSGMSHVVIEQVYSTLMALDPDARPYPELAESYTVSNDGLAYTFRLRRGVRFHNGDELTSADVKFTFDRLRAPNSGYSYGAQVETIKSVDAVDTYTVRFNLTKRTGPFLIYMAFPGSSIVPKKLVESGHDLNARPVGTGPFKFVSYEPRNAIKFERNPNYFERGKPYFDAMEYRIIADITALTNALLSGVVNFSNEIPPKDFAKVKANPDLVALTLEGSRYHWLLPNNKKAPLDNPKVRQAISYAIDRRALVEGAFFGLATPIMGGVIPKWNWGYADLQFVPPRGDPEKAKALLAEAGYPNGFEIGMACPDAGYPKINEVCQAISEQLNAIGVKNELELQEANAYWDREAKKELPPLFVDSWSVTIGEAWPRLSGALNKGETYANWYDPKLDEMINQVVVTVDTEKRAELYREIQRYMRENPPFVYLYYPEAFEAVRTRVQGYKPRSAENYFLWEVSVSD